VPLIGGAIRVHPAETGWLSLSGILQKASN